MTREPSGGGDPARPGAEEHLHPIVQVVRGSATPEELAAVVAVLGAVGDGGGDPAPARHTAWASRERVTGAALRPGPTAWRASADPR